MEASPTYSDSPSPLLKQNELDESPAYSHSPSPLLFKDGVETEVNNQPDTN